MNDPDEDVITEPNRPTYDAGGGPTIRAVTLGALSVPVAPPSVSVAPPDVGPRVPASPARRASGWAVFLLGALAGAAAVGAAWALLG